jgi:hypothetical protein
MPEDLDHKAILHESPVRSQYLPQAPLVSAVISGEDAGELARLRDFLLILMDARISARWRDAGIRRAHLLSFNGNDRKALRSLRQRPPTRIAERHEHRYTCGRHQVQSFIFLTLGNW